jgi:hypothetical protein
VLPVHLLTGTAGGQVDGETILIVYPGQLQQSFPAHQSTIHILVIHIGFSMVEKVLSSFFLLGNRGMPGHTCRHPSGIITDLLDIETT